MPAAKAAVEREQLTWWKQWVSQVQPWQAHLLHGSQEEQWGQAHNLRWGLVDLGRSRNVDSYAKRVHK